MHRILIVDDDPNLLDGLARALRPFHHEFEVSTAPGGRQAMGQLSASRFDLVVLDLLMPGQDGVETIMAIRKMHPEVKVIAMSGGGRIMGMELLQIAMRLGAQSTIAKPFTPEALVAAARKVLAK